MPELAVELFGWFSLPLTDLAAVNHHIVLVGDAINPDVTKGKLVEAHR